MQESYEYCQYNADLHDSKQKKSWIMGDLTDATAQALVLKISFSSCIIGNSTHTDTMKAAAYEITTTPVNMKA